jgi:carboxyl-terminal processing protease
MKLFRTLLWPIGAISVATLVCLGADEPDPGQVQISVGRLLEQGHYSRKKLDDNVSRELLKNYLETLDYNRLFFTQKDIEGFTGEYATTLDDDILLGNPDPAFKIYEVFRQRVEDRIAKVKGQLGQTFEFKSDATIEINRQKAPWPKDEAEADEIWRTRLEGEMLQETLNKHAINPPLKTLTRRYDQQLRNLREQTKEDMIKTFLSSLAQTYDPHSEYMSRSELENFSINMRLSLVGIGAVLNSEEGYAKIMELVPGGPASKDGRLKVGDRVTAVAQGDKEFVDSVDMKLDKVVEMIRGKKDSVVKLQVIPVNSPDPSVRKVIEIKRDEIKLKEQEARAEVVERVQADGSVLKLGWITLPSFYADMDRSGSSTAKSTTKDVLALLNRLKQENISGLVMDLRRDGGGSLEEAVNLTGLFIKKGPVVQSKDSSGGIHVSRDRDPSIAYDGPMVVVTNRLSASASEIFAAALQDYNRAVIVGDSSTFGKGTVQTMLEIGRAMPFLGSGGSEAGALKLTIQKFYRVAGGSTQLRGVEPDIKLPSPFDHPEIGEGAMKGPLPYDTVDPVPFEKLDRSLFRTELRDRSSARVGVSPEFGYITEDLEVVKKRLAENKLSLNIEQRRAEIAEEKARKERRTADRAKMAQPNEKRFALTLDDISKPKLQLVTNESKKEATAGNAGLEAKASATDSDEDEAADADSGKPSVDAVRFETLNILGDLVSLTRGGKGATASAAR